jgi:hypothetical protein
MRRAKSEGVMPVRVLVEDRYKARRNDLLSNAEEVEASGIQPDT